MEKSISSPTLFKPYLILTKPGIIVGNAITAIGGFALAAHGFFDLPRLFAMLAGLSLIIASACVCNNYIDRHIDKMMESKRRRPLVTGVVRPNHALIYATLLGLIGVCILSKWTTLTALFASLLGFFVYIALYTRLKRRALHNTLIGSIAGAVPPVVGYTAVTGQIDLASLILFGAMVLWQMPHFFAITIYRLKDYAAASIPVLSVRKGIKQVKFQMPFYIASHSAVSSLLTFCGYVNTLYLVVTGILGTAWFCLAIRGLKTRRDEKWARQMFICSLLVVVTLFVFIPFCVY